MKVLILGSGGREHALCKSISDSNKISKVYCLPGNAGTNLIAENIEINLNDFENIKNFIIKNKIHLVIVGPEQPLVDGIVDYLEEHKINVFGPSKLASQLEGSKIFTKNLCKKYKIPTADFGIFQNIEESYEFLNKCKMPIVIKADGLAAGKGVYICENKNDSFMAVDANAQIIDDADLVLDFDPVELKLAGPNPFNPTTSLNVVVAEAGHVSVNVYNVVGQKVATLLNDYLNINTSGYTVNWDASNLSSGVYLVRAETANSISTQKLMLLK